MLLPSLSLHEIIKLESLFLWQQNILSYLIKLVGQIRGAYGLML